MYALHGRESILKTSVAEVTSDAKHFISAAPCLQRGVPGHSPCDGLQDHVSLNTLCDTRMGVRAPNETCVTCWGAYAECAGHHGHISLAAPVYARHFVPELKRVLKKLCARCLVNPAFHPRCAEGMGACVGACKNIAFGKEDGLLHVERPSGAEVWSAARTRAVLRNLAHAKLGVPPDVACLVVDCLEVMPPARRPYAKFRGGGSAARWAASEITRLYAKVVQENRKVAFCLDRPQLELDLATGALQQAVNILFDSSNSKAAAAGGPQPEAVSSLWGDVQGKEGLLRGNLLGKRVTNTARSVIVGDPAMRTDQVGVPRSICNTLTFPEAITSLNVHKWRARVVNEESWASVAIDGEEYLRAALDYRHLCEISAKLKTGDLVHRSLQDDDVVLVNRQPTLHRTGFMGHRVVVMDTDAIHLHPNATKSYNADFDGDEMNLHSPRTIEAAAEFVHLMAFAENLVSPNSQPTASFVQNALLALHLFTADDVFLSRDEACQILASMDSKDVFLALPPPAIGAPLCPERQPDGRWRMAAGTKRWTGKQLVSTLLPKTCTLEHKNVVIRGGALLQGQLGKPDLGSAPGGLFHFILLNEGAREGLLFFDRLNWMVTAFLNMRGFSVGMQDCFLKVPVDGVLADATEKPAMPALEPGDEADQLREVFTQGMARAAALMDILVGPTFINAGNAFEAMYTAGSKGTPGNMAQIIFAVGSQEIDGELPPLYLGTRALPCERPGGNTPKSRGYVASSYVEGLDPVEVWKHLASARKSLVDSKMLPAVSGYMQRQTAQSLQNFRVNALGQVVGDRGELVQLRYGDDGLDFCSMHRTLVAYPSLESVRLLDREEFLPQFKPPNPVDLAVSLEHRARLFCARPEPHEDEEEARRVFDLLEATGTTPLAQKVLHRRFPAFLHRFDVLLPLCEYVAYHTLKSEAAPGLPVGILAAQTASACVTQRNLNVFHHTGSKEASNESAHRMNELIGAKLEDVDIPLLTILSDTPAEVGRLLSARPVVKAYRRAGPADLQAPWARDWFAEFGVPEQRNVLRIEFERDALIGPRALEDLSLVFDCPVAHSHEEYEEDAAMLVFTHDAREDWADTLVSKLDRSARIAERANLENGLLRAVVRGKDAIHRAACAITKAGGRFGIASNDIGDVLRTFGIEAARASMYDQMAKLGTFSDGYFNRRHLLLLVDAMCFSGRPRAAKQSGLGLHTWSPLGQACFERPVQPLVRAAVCRKKENVENVSAGVILGKRTPLGTGSHALQLLLDESAVYKDLLPPESESEDDEMEVEPVDAAAFDDFMPDGYRNADAPFWIAPGSPTSDESWAIQKAALQGKDGLQPRPYSPSGAFEPRSERSQSPASERSDGSQQYVAASPPGTPDIFD